MNQLGKNVVLSLCVVATLLVILGIKRRLGDGDPSLLSQPAESSPSPVASANINSLQPRVVQAKPITQQDQIIVSPMSSEFSQAGVEPPSDSIRVISPMPTSDSGSGSGSAPRHPTPMADESSPRTHPDSDRVASGDDSGSLTTNVPTVPIATRPRPEFVITTEDDSFWTISEQIYGSGTYYRALFRHNESKVLRPDQLRAGIEIRTPPPQVLHELYPADFPAEAVSSQVVPGPAAND